MKIPNNTNQFSSSDGTLNAVDSWESTARFLGDDGENKLPIADTEEIARTSYSSVAGFGGNASYINEASSIGHPNYYHFSMDSVGNSQNDCPMDFQYSFGGQLQLPQPTPGTVPEHSNTFCYSTNTPSFIHDRVYSKLQNGSAANGQNFCPMGFRNSFGEHLPSSTPTPGFIQDRVNRSQTQMPQQCFVSRMHFNNPIEAQSQSHMFQHDESYHGSTGRNEFQQRQPLSEQLKGIQMDSTEVPNASNSLFVSLQQRILKYYADFKRSRAFISGGYTYFVNYMHRAFCSNTKCRCGLYISLASHFDTCVDSHCHLCESFRELRVEDKCHQRTKRDFHLEQCKGIKSQSVGLSQLLQQPNTPSCVDYNAKKEDSNTNSMGDVIYTYVGLKMGAVPNPSKELAAVGEPKLIDLTGIDEAVPVAKSKAVAPAVYPELEMASQMRKLEGVSAPEFSKAEPLEENSQISRQFTNKCAKRVFPGEDYTQLSHDISKDMPSSKRVRVENQCSIESGIPCARSPSIGRPLASERLPNWRPMTASTSSSDTEVTEGNTDSRFTGNNENRETVPDTNEVLNWDRMLEPASISERRDEVIYDCDKLSSKTLPVSPEKLVYNHEEKKIPEKLSSKTVPVPPEKLAYNHEEKEIPNKLSSKTLPASPEEHFDNHEEKEVPVAEAEPTAPKFDSELEIKSGKQKIEGVSLTEFFTAEQLREHLLSLRQLTDKVALKELAGNMMACSTSDNSCQLCGMEKLSFAPTPIYCSCCGRRIKHKLLYYCTSDDTAPRHCFCTSCYRDSRGGNINTLNGAPISKAKLSKKKNEEGEDESWVQCDRCESWQHQICSLFNNKRNLEGKAEYICPSCSLKEIEAGNRNPLPESAAFCAKDLPRSKLSDHLEQRLLSSLKKERGERAKIEGKNPNKVPGAEDLVVRVVSSVKKQLKVGEQFLSIFPDKRYPSEFPYRSKVILMFQRIEGVDVCLFVMNVHEFGSECSYPNQRSVYISYLDSIKYFRPEINTSTGEALRTFVYHEILIGYLDYCKRRGFATCYLWASPPAKGEDYILYCHPETQKTPKSKKLRQWYTSFLRKAANEEIVAEFTNLYDHFFMPFEECKSKVTAARLPYLDSDYWLTAAEDIIKEIEQESREELQKKAMKLLPRNSKAEGTTIQSDHAAKDILLMRRLGEVVARAKEDFFVIHLQFVCANCHEVIPSESRCLCSPCKKFQLCERCHDEKLDLNQRNTCRDQEKSLPKVVVDVKPSDTEDYDIDLDIDFFESRQNFLSFCQENSFQFDTLRRAKHSSMMILYHFRTSFLSSVRATCRICKKNTVEDRSCQSEISPELSVCRACHEKGGAVSHTDKPIERDHSPPANYATERKECGLTNGMVKELLSILLHASQCQTDGTHQCSKPNCSKIKALFRHATHCSIRVSRDCVCCRRAWTLMIMHSESCENSGCRVPRCADLKRGRKKSGS